MVISYVLRLRSDDLANGRFVGEIEAVATRRKGPVRNADQITVFVLDTAVSQALEVDSAAALVHWDEDVPVQ
ncbi:MAG TPA: hypothetical protein VGG23_03155 [Acidimicrobiales bacterium]|jgi:hypothetical protein